MLTCVLAITVLACTVLLVSPKAEAATEGDYTYRVSGGKATITGYTGSGGDITIPATLGGYPVTAIGNYAFSDCNRLTSVTIGDSVTSIGYEAFYKCDSLTSVTIGDSVTTIGDYAFAWCYSLTSVTIPDSVTSIGNSAFRYCSSLTDVYITDPNAWCKISFGNSYASPMDYGDCLHILDDNGNEVTELVLDNTVTAIPDDAFRGSAITAVTIPDSVTSIGSSAFEYCTSLTGIWVDENNVNYSSDSYGVLFNKDKTTLIQAPGGISGSYTIPNSVTSIGDSAFNYCTSLTSVTIPDSVTSIGYEAFSYCSSLTSVTIPDSVTTIGNYAFACCYSLTSVTIPDSVTSIGYGAFSGCTSLTSVTIGDSVTSIGGSAFFDCYSLTDVYYGGTQAQWNAIGIGSWNYDLESATIHYQHIHDYTLLPATTVNPTCTEKGYTEYTCVWGETYRDDYVPALGHSTGADGVVTPPTCTAQGYTTSTCPRCGVTATTDYVTALGHDYSGSAVTVDPTCTEEGYTGNTCTRCGDVQKKTVTDALGHKMALVPASDPTCEKPGLSAGTACERCGLVVVAQQELPMLPHSFVDGSCTGCGKPERKPGDIDGNQSVDRNDVIKLLLHVTMPNSFPIDCDADFNGDGVVNRDDVIKLLLHVTMPNSFPLEVRKKD